MRSGSIAWESLCGRWAWRNGWNAGGSTRGGIGGLGVGVGVCRSRAGTGISVVGGGCSLGTRRARRYGRRLRLRHYENSAGNRKPFLGRMVRIV